MRGSMNQFGKISEVTMEYAEKNSSYEIQRAGLLAHIQSLFVGDGKKVVNLYGTSGIGKTHLCRTLYQFFSTKPYGTILIDFDQSEYNNIPRIIDYIVANLGINNFIETCNLIKEYYDSVDAGKSAILEKCLESLINEINLLSTQKKLVFIFDTFEALPLVIQDTELKKIVQSFKSNIFTIISGINKVPYDSITDEIELHGFTVEEIQKYFSQRNKGFKKLFSKQGNLTAGEIQEGTDGGHPIICGLLSDYLIHNANIKNKESIARILRQALDENKDEFYGHLVSWIENLPDERKEAIRLTAFFNDRMTPELLNRLSGMDISKSKKTIEEISEFSFIKSYTGENKITMHQIAARIIRSKFIYSNDELIEFANKAVEEYDRLIEKDLTHSQAVRSQTSLRVERVMCLVRNSTFDMALRALDAEVLNCLESYDYSLVTQLMSAVEHWCYEEHNTLIVRWEYVIRLYKGEVLLNKYLADEAIMIADTLRTEDLYTDEQLSAMTDSLYGRTLVNPCTVERDASLNEAIDVLTRSFMKLEEMGFSFRSVKTALWLGIAYTRNGQNEYANTKFCYARSNCVNKIQEVSIILEMSKMVRLEQNVPESDRYIKECYRILSEDLQQKNKGKLYYYQGNVCRDLGQFSNAIEYYEKAFEELKRHDDEFTLCELNLDYAWLEYLWNEPYDRNKVKKYLDEGWKIAKKYKFGTEYSEYYHMRYELEHYESDYINAYDDLKTALDFAYKYNNVYMIMDCLNHKAQMYFEQGQYDLIPEVIIEMERIQNKGCKIRVFTGRAMLVQADVYYLKRNYRCALATYLEAFLIVALYGNSYSNVELFGDLFKERKQKLQDCYSRIADASKLLDQYKTQWLINKVSSEFVYFLDGFL